MFNDLLQATLTLTIGGNSFTVLAGAIGALRVDAKGAQFSAEISFWVSSEGVADELLTPFVSTDLIQGKLELGNGRLALEAEVAALATFLGYVTTRAFEETTSDDLAGEPIIERYYTIELVDAAQAFWRQHRPLALYADTSLREAIEKQVVEGVTLSFDWPRLDQTEDIVCIGLGGNSPASFYDFLVWLVADLGGVIELDASSGSYRIAQSKADAEDATALDAESVAAVRVLFPPLQRQSVAVLNPFSEAVVTKLEVANTLSAKGVRRDVVAHTPVPEQAEQRAALEKERLRQRDHHLEVEYAELPHAFPIPGLCLSVGEGFSQRIFAATKTYRSIRLQLSAGPPRGEPDEADYGDAAARFGIELRVELERDTDAVPNLPAHAPPPYPVLAEGRVLSASGGPTDRTWHVLSSEADSVIRYRVYVPLWNQTIVAPFVPFGESGHFFFPAYKNQRVLLAFELGSAKIVSFLDWAGKLPIDTQGNQLVMGKRESSSTVVKHVYTDDSPVLTIARTEAGDKQTVELSEGRFFLEVREDETAATVNETYDLTPQADVAKASAAASAQANLGALGGTYSSSMGTTSAALNAAGGEVEAGVAGATGELSSTIQDVQAKLSDKAAQISAAADELAAKVAQAKAELEKALDDDEEED
jgi:hypothetical protein